MVIVHVNQATAHPRGAEMGQLVDRAEGCVKEEGPEDRIIRRGHCALFAILPHFCFNSHFPLPPIASRREEGYLHVVRKTGNNAKG